MANKPTAGQNTASDLKKSAAHYNPRTITKEQLDRLKKAIQEFGDLGGIIKNIRTGNLVGGHQRVKVIPKDALIEKTDLAAPSRTGTVAHGYIVINGEKYSYREVDWDEKREKAANIAANAHGGDWDEQKLNDILKELSADINLDLDLIGFDLADVHQILGEDFKNSSADNLMELSDQLRAARATFKEVQKKLEETDDVINSYLVVCFKGWKERKAFTDMLSLPDNRYVDGRTLQKYLIAPSPETAE